MALIFQLLNHSIILTCQVFRLDLGIELRSLGSDCDLDLPRHRSDIELDLPSQSRFEFTLPSLIGQMIIALN